MRYILWLPLVAILLTGCMNDNKPEAHVQGTMQAPGPSSWDDTDQDSQSYTDSTDGSYGDASSTYTESYDTSSVGDSPDTIGSGSSTAATPINTSAAPTYTPAPSYQPSSVGGQTYVIQRNDTLWAISKRFLGAGSRWQEIVAVNPGLEPRRLRIGQQINIPPR